MTYERYSEAQVRQVIQHSAKRILLAGKSAVVKYDIDGDKLLATYDDGDGHRETFEVSVNLQRIEGAHEARHSVG